MKPGVYRAKVTKYGPNDACYVVIPQVFLDKEVPLADYVGTERPSLGSTGYVAYISGDSAWPVWLGGGLGGGSYYTSVTGQFFDVTEYGAVGDGVTDDTDAVVAAVNAAEENLGGVVYLPAGQYVLTSTIEISVSSITLLGDGTSPIAERSDGSVLHIRHAGIGIDVLSTAAAVKVTGLHLYGAGTDTEHVAHVGVMLRGGERHLLENLTTSRFSTAGYCFDKTQNTEVRACGSYMNKWGYWIVNASRNIRFFNCNATFADKGSYLNTAETAMVADARAMKVGFATNPVGVTQQTYSPQYLATPSAITATECIWERYGDSDYVLELLEGYDRFVFDTVEMIRANVAVVRIGPDFNGDGQVDASDIGRPFFIRCTATAVDSGSNVVTPYLNEDEARTPLYMDERELNRFDQSFQDTNIIQPITTDDSLQGKNILSTPTRFVGGIGSPTLGGSGTATHEPSTRGMSLFSTGQGQAGGGWIDIPFKNPWKSTAGWAWDTSHVLEIVYDVSDFSGSVPMEVRVLTTGSPRTIGYISSAGQGLIRYNCQGDETTAIRFISSTWADDVTVEFKYLAAFVNPVAVAPIDYVGFVTPDENWREVADPDEPVDFENSYVNYDTIWDTAAFRIDAEGWVHLKGLVDTGSKNTTIFTLPEGYWPEKQIVYTTLVYDTVASVAPAFVRVETDGKVKIDYAAPNGSVSTWGSLSGVQFPTAGGRSRSLSMVPVSDTPYLRPTVFKRDNGMCVVQGFSYPTPATSYYDGCSGEFGPHGDSYMFAAVDQTGLSKRWDVSAVAGLRTNTVATSNYAVMTGEYGTEDIYEQWTVPSLLNSWVNFGVDTIDNWSNVGYYKDQFGFVHLRGLLKSGSSADADMFQLPAEHRPAKPQLFISFASGTPSACRIDIDENGYVNAQYNGSTSETSLSGISFYADQ